MKSIRLELDQRSLTFTNFSKISSAISDQIFHRYNANSPQYVTSEHSSLKSSPYIECKLCGKLILKMDRDFHLNVVHGRDSDPNKERNGWLNYASVSYPLLGYSDQGGAPGIGKTSPT